MSVATSLRASVAEIAPDTTLPQLASLLDPDLMSGILGRSLRPDLRAPGVRISYVRYRPTKSLVVGYDVTLGELTHGAFALADARVDLAGRAAAQESAALVAKLAGRTPTRTPLAYEAEVDALVQWLPLDLALPAMAEPPEHIRARVAAAGLELESDDIPRVVKHKPMTRGILRFDRHIAKMYPDEESFAASVRAVEASSSLPFPTARRTAVVPELLLATQTLVPGRRPDGNADTAALAGALLAVLHSTPSQDVPLQRPRDQLRWAAKQSRLLASIAPHLASRLNRLVATLEACMPSAELVLSHGDFHSGQLLQSDGELGVVDFDGMCLAPAALDIASYVVSRVERPEDLAPAEATLEILVDAYGSRPQGIRWYLAGRLLRHARRPFVRFKPGWPDEVEACVAAAEASLEL
jgi:hypothetical protein